TFKRINMRPVLHNTKIFDLQTDDHNSLWAATSEGVLYYANGQSRLIDFGSESEGSQCNDMYMSDSASLWIATVSEVYKINLHTLKTVRYGVSSYGGDIQSVLFGNNRLFLGLVDGLSVTFRP